MPVLPILGGDTDVPCPSGGLFVDAIGVDVAVGGAIALQLAVDRLEDVELAARGPVRVVAHRVAQQPGGSSEGEEGGELEEGGG